MKIALYVHDLFLEIGHSNALVETIRNLPKDHVEEVVVVSYSTGDLNEYFGNLNCTTKFVKVPFMNIRPVLLKVLFYIVYAHLYSTIFLRSNYKKVGVGVAYPWVDIINIQFVHRQWEKYYFKMFRGAILKKLYKKALFILFNFLEDLAFTNQKLYSSLSKFTTNYLKEEFHINDSRLITNYSGINLKKFCPLELSKKDILMELESEYPQLSGIDLEKPIYIFVGAYERKGLDLLIKKMKDLKTPQFIVIGKHEEGSGFTFPADLNVFKVEFTKKLQHFYSLADSFVFASIYEPFGLVIIEAAAMGLELFVTEENVGAVELLHDLDGIHIYKNEADFSVDEVQVSNYQLKLERRNSRMKRLENYTWKDTGLRFYKLLQRL
jgi:glycosyltransferase involved in cell wall biosynthesis